MAMHRRMGLLLGTQLSRPQTLYWFPKLLLCLHGHLSGGGVLPAGLWSQQPCDVGKATPFRDGRDEVTISVLAASE